MQQAGDRNNVLVDLGKVEALLPRSEQVLASATSRLADQAVITDVRTGTKGPQVILSRRDRLIKTLFELQVPGVADGPSPSRASRANPATARSRRAVAYAGVDPVGACVGLAARVSGWSSPSSAEVDIIPWNQEPAVRRGALARARPRSTSTTPARGDGRRPRRPALAIGRRG